MAAIGRNSLPIVTTTRVELGPGQTISTYNFLRGLRRPKPKDTAILAPAKNVPSIPDSNSESLVDVAAAVSVEGSGRPGAGYDRARKAENLRGDGVGSSEAPKNTQIYSQRVKLTLLQEEASRDPSPLFCSQGLSEGEERDLDGHFQSRKDATKTTYDGKSVCGTEASNEITRTSLPGPDDHCIQHCAKQQSNVAIATDSDKSSKNTSRRARNKKNKKRRTKRRVPVGELELMSKLPADAESSEAIKHDKSQPITVPASGGEGQPRKVLDDLDLALLGEIDGYDSTGMAKSKPPKGSNIGKPVTRIRKELSLPRHHRISHEGFKFPVTPRPKRNPGWKLGSGFEGIELQRSTPSTIKQTYNAVTKRVKHNRFQTPNPRALEVCTTLSPSAKAAKYTAVKKGELNFEALVPLTGVSGVGQNRDLHPIPKIGAFRTLGMPHRGQMHDATQLSPPVESQAAQDLQKSYRSGSQMLSPERNRTKYRNSKQSPDTRAIRKPSRSEQNGWLKRKRQVRLATASDEYKKSVDRKIHPQAKDESTESIFDRHNATWYRESSTHAAYSQTCQDAASHQRDDGNHQQRLSIAHSAHCMKSVKGETRKSDLQAGSSESQDIIPDSGSLSQTSQLPYPSQERSRNLEGLLAASPNKSNYMSSLRFRVAPSHESPEVQDSQEQNATECTIRGMDIAIPSQADQTLESENAEQNVPVSSKAGSQRSHGILQPSFNASRQFTNAVQQPSLPLERPVATPIRKSKRHAQNSSSPKIRRGIVPRVAFSTQQGSHGANVLLNRSLGRARTEGGNLKLGLTPRLQRSMTTLPFRPPFKPLV